MFEKLGAETGFDSINDFEIAHGLKKLCKFIIKPDLLKN